MLGFFEVEKARDQLIKLHKDYPATSIPTLNKLFIVVYNAEWKDNAAKKMVFEIKVAEEGGYYIDMYENQHKKPKVPPNPNKEAASEEAASPSGYFTSMIAMKTKKKAPLPTAKQETEEGGENAS